MHGIGLLLPFNAIFAAMDYFKQLFPKSENYHPDFTIVVAVSASMLFSQVLSILFLERIPIKLRLGVTFAVNTVFTACIGLLPSVLETSHAYLVVLGMCLVYGVSLALL